MVTGILHELGLWLGKTVPGGNLANRKGFFENARLRESVNKQILKQLECDPLGVRKLPELNTLPKISGLREAVETLIKEEGYGGHSKWGFKDAKLTLLWPYWHEAFPRAQWIIVHRPRRLVIQSCLKTSFMKQHSGDELFWDQFCDVYEARLTHLKAKISAVVEIDSSELVQGQYHALKSIAENAGLDWDVDRVRNFIDPQLWGSRNPGN